MAELLTEDDNDARKFDLGSRNFDRLARKNLTRMLNALKDVGQKPVADACGVAVSQVSRWTEKDLPRFAVALSTMRLQVNKSDTVRFPPEYMVHMRYFAKLGFDLGAVDEDEPE